MGMHELEDLYRLPSNFSDDVLEAARQWADEIRPGLKGLDGTVVDPHVRADVISPITKLENRVSSMGVSSSQSLAELALIGMRISKEKEMEK